MRMKVRFLGQHIVNKEEMMIYTKMKIKHTYKWEVFHECEMDRELKEGNYVNINGDTRIERVTYELDGSISYRTSRVLSEI
jgi:hypothetical protein